MKKLYASVLFMAMATLSFGQYYYLPHFSPGQNPGGLNTDSEYPSGGGLPAGWATVLGGGNSTVTWSPAQTIPFSFNFNGSAVTQYKVSSNGVLTFDVASTAVPPTTNTALPNASLPNKSVMVWGIESPGTNDIVVSKTFGTAPNRQHWVFFSSYAAGANWTYWSIVLEEGSDKIYIVDQRHLGTITGLTLGVQVDGTMAMQVMGSPAVSSLAGSDPSGADNVYYEFIQGNQPGYDMSVLDESMDDNVISGQAPFDISGTIANYGALPVNSFDLNYSINGGNAVTANVSGTNIAAYNNYSFTHPTQWSPSTTGNYTIEVWASNINGNADLNTSNDRLSFTVNVVDTFVTRNSLLEVFTSSTCVPCRPGNEQMDNNVVPNIDNYTIVKYQQNFPGAGDPYFTTTSVNRRNYYNINSIPRMEIDGQWDQNAQSFDEATFNSYQSVPAFIDFTFNEAFYYGNMVQLDFDVNSYTDFTGNVYRVQAAIVEKQTVQNVASNGETEFNYVMMDMLPDENGSPIGPLTKNGSINVTRTADMTATNVEEMADLKVVVWVENFSTKQIMNSAWADITLTVGLEENMAQGNLRALYPNPTTDQATVQFTTSNNENVKLEVFNAMGQLVSSDDLGSLTDGVHEHTISTAKLTAGIYFVTLHVGNEQSTERLMVID